MCELALQNNQSGGFVTWPTGPTLVEYLVSNLSNDETLTNNCSQIFPDKQAHIRGKYKTFPKNCVVLGFGIPGSTRFWKTWFPTFQSETSTRN